MEWDYANLSHMAKINGGPEALVESIEMGGVLAGRKQMLPVVVAALLVGIAIPPQLKKSRGSSCRSPTLRRPQ